MKKWMVVLTTFVIAVFNLNAFACGPTPQKVVKEITIKADPKTVWAVMDKFDAIALWHPDVQSSVMIQKTDEDGNAESDRVIKLKSGLTIEEKRRTTPNTQMKLDYQMTAGDFLVSNYRGVMQVKEGNTNGETIVTWTGRFNNKANTLAAPVEQDNDAAILAISTFYDDGLKGLKTFIEK